MKEKVIVALDFENEGDALNLVDVLGESVQFYKVGLEMFAGGFGYSVAQKIIKDNKKVFVDLKLFDIPETVLRTTKKIKDLGAEFLTVHPEEDVIKSAVLGAKDSNLKILVVTLLTSIETNNAKEIVLKNAEIAYKNGADGIICSPREAKDVKNKFKDELLVITPSIRLGGGGDDQKRFATPKSAIENGADYIVIGRPIKNSNNPKETVEKLFDV